MNILIVDDNPTNLNVLLDYLHDQDYKVLIAPSGEQALQQITHFQPDLILLDVMMPGLDGFETCARLKANPITSHIPVIMVSVLDNRELALTLGAMLGGAIIIEQVFFLPGLGRLIFQAISQRDLIVVESVVMLLVFAVIVVNFLVDLAYALVDPRLKHGR
mgnify:CR=1 FL=1